MSRLTKLTFLTGAVILGMIAGTAIADTGVTDPFFHWVAKNGALAFTDDESRIPKTYREEAVLRQFERTLEKRTQMIITERDQRERLEKRLDYLRSQNEVKSTPVEAPTVIITVEKTRRRVRSRGPGK